MNYIAQNVKFYRIHNRFTQQEVADKFKVTIAMLKSYESGGATPLVETLVRIADMMQVSLDTLVKIKLNKNNYLKVKGQSDPDLLSRVEALEKAVSNPGTAVNKPGIAVNKNVNKKLNQTPKRV